MKVLLKRVWFVGGGRFKPGKPSTRPVEIPDHLLGQLPRGAEIVGEDYKPPVVEAPAEPETLAELGRMGQTKSVAEELADAHIDAQTAQWPPKDPEEKDASNA